MTCVYASLGPLPSSGIFTSVSVGLARPVSLVPEAGRECQEIDTPGAASDPLFLAPASYCYFPSQLPNKPLCSNP